MELKVWCEGIQRVISGVSESTTCHDLVVALAQAMGKTGRYSLVEKWRESERLVSPDENPLVVLQKWGEYANDVQFILRHSGKRTGSGGPQDDKRTSKLSYHNFTPHLSESHSSSMSSLKKSLTFSGAHSQSVLVPKLEGGSRMREPRDSIQEDSSLDSLTEQSSQFSQSSRSTYANSSAYSSLEQSRRKHQPNSISSQSSVSSLNPRNKTNVFQNSNNQSSTSQHSNTPFSYTSGSSFGGSLDRTRKRNSQRSYANQPQSSNSALPSQSSSSHILNSYTDTNGHVSPARDKPPLINSVPPPSRLKESNNNMDYKPNANLVPSKTRDSITPDKQTQDEALSKTVNGQDTDDAVKRADLIKLVNLQMEKLQKQEEQLTDIEKEVKSQESIEKQQLEDEAKTLAEISRLEHIEGDMDTELQDLELVSWVDKLEMEREKEKRLKREIGVTREKLKECQKELEKKQNMIKQLTEEITKQKVERSKEEQEDKKEELKVLQEISDLQKQINSHLVKHEEQQGAVEDLQADVKKLQSIILERKTQIGDLERELKDTNLEKFARAPTDWMRGSHDGRTLFDRSPTSRPGSARRLESPQRLKEAVATAKNPHGLWV